MSNGDVSSIGVFYIDKFYNDRKKRLARRDNLYHSLHSLCLNFTHLNITVHLSSVLLREVVDKYFFDVYKFKTF